VARTYKTLSISMPPGAVEQLAAIGKPTGRVAARVAAEIVLREIQNPIAPRVDNRRHSWCCQAPVSAIASQVMLPETDTGDRLWIPVVVLVCYACRKQMHGREYEGWLADAR
jgi:hypothetical protein